jgi:hypothetical protein
LGVHFTSSNLTGLSKRSKKSSNGLTLSSLIIKEEAKIAGAEILFADQTGVNTGSFKKRSYSPIGVTPVIPLLVDSV